VKKKVTAEDRSREDSMPGRGLSICQGLKEVILAGDLKKGLTARVWKEGQSAMFWRKMSLLGIQGGIHCRALKG
jgi:hypothetical protein